MALSEFFLNNFETSDNALDQRLKPNYYNNDYHTTQHLITSCLNQVGFKMINVDNYYHEMLFEYKRIRVIVILNEMSLYDIRVDMKINAKYVLPLKRPIKIIAKLYEILDRKLTLKYLGGERNE